MEHGGEEAQERRSGGWWPCRNRQTHPNRGPCACARWTTPREQRGWKWKPPHAVQLYNCSQISTKLHFSAVAMPPVFHPAAVSHLLAFAVAGDATDRWLYDSAQHVCHCWRVAAREALLVSEQLRLRARAAALLARMERLSPRPEDYAHRCGPHGRLPLTDMNVLLRGLQACAFFLVLARRDPALVIYSR